MASSIKDNLKAVLDRIAVASNNINGENQSPDVIKLGGIKLIAATKTQSLEVIAEYRACCAEFGIQARCGENYAQELESKASHFPDIEWHFIGRVQRNKAATLVKHCHMIHSVASVRALEAIAAETQKQSKQVEILLQVNISKDLAKDGLLPEQLSLLPSAGGHTAQSEPIDFSIFKRMAVLGAPVVGLMTILEYGLTQAQSRFYYSQVSELTAQLRNQANSCFAHSDKAPECSMGMSSDFDVAIEQGATMVRVGSALFGHRI